MEGWHIKTYDLTKIFGLGLVALVIFLVLIFAIGVAFAKAPQGAPQSTPQEKEFFKGAQNSMRGSCCSEADGYREGFAYPWTDGGPRVVLDEWRPGKEEGAFEVKVLGQWYPVAKELVVQCGPNARDSRDGSRMPATPCNPTGGAVVWIIPKFHGFVIVPGEIAGIRCFAPGFQT